MSDKKLRQKCTMGHAVTFFVFGIGSSDFYTVRITPGWNAQKWYPCVYFRNRGGTPSVLNPFWKSWIFKKEHFSKNIYPYLGTPIHQIARKSTNRTYVPCLEKKLEIKILKTQKVTVVWTCTFSVGIFSEMFKIQGFLLRASRGDSYVRS